MKYAWKLGLAGFLGIGLSGGLIPSALAFTQFVEVPASEFSGVAVNNSQTSETLSADSEASSPADLSLLEAGRERYASGQYAAAAAAWQAASEAAAAGNDALTEAVALSYLSLAYQELNQWNAATAALDTSLALLENADSEAVSPNLWAQVLNTKAALDYHLGNAESALALWEHSEEFYRQAGDRTGQLGSQINQAQALQSLGFYRRSRQQLESVAEVLATMPDSELKVNGLRTLGNALQVLGDLSASRAALFESANIAIAIDSTNELSTTYLSMARTARDWGDETAAMDMFVQARQTALNPADELQADLGLLQLYVKRSDAENSALVAAELAAQIESLPASRLSVYGTVNMGASLAQEQELGQSLGIDQLNELLAKAVHSARELDDKQAEAYALNQWGALYMQTQQWDDALTLTEKSPRNCARY